MVYLKGVVCDTRGIFTCLDDCKQRVLGFVSKIKDYLQKCLDVAIFVFPLPPFIHSLC